MSSKQQYKDALKRQKQVIVKMSAENENLTNRLKIVIIKLRKLEGTLNKNKSKWYQFWK